MEPPWKEAQPFNFFDDPEHKAPPPGMAERRAKLEDDLANQLETNGYSDSASEHRTKAAWWRKLATCNEKDTWRKSKYDALAGADALIALAERSGEHYENPSLEHLKVLASHLLWGLHMLAANGNENAASIWGDVLLDSTKDFERLAWDRPQLITGWARKQATIPGRISTYAGLAKSNDDLVKVLRVGESSLVPLAATRGRGNRLDYSMPANHVASELIWYIERERGFCELYRYHAERAGKSLPAWLERASNLKPFDDQTWERWAEAAWEIVMDATSRMPEMHVKLKPLGEAAAKKKPKLVKTLHPATASGNARSEIKRRLFKAIKSMALRAVSRKI
jgi:hypothetical protein